MEKHYELEKIVYLNREANDLASYLVLIREVIDKVTNAASIVSIILHPNCPEAEGDFGLYLQYAERTLGKETRDKLWKILESIHEFSVRHEELPLNIRSEAIKEINSIINELPKKYAITPNSLNPSQCLRKHLHLLRQ